MVLNLALGLGYLVLVGAAYRSDNLLFIMAYRDV